MAAPETPKSRWTLAAFRQGAFAMLPLLPGVAAFSMAVGTVAARKGFTLLDLLVMTATVYGGMAQMIVLESWPEQLTIATIVGAGAIAGIVSLRFLLIGASLRPWFGNERAGRIYPMLYLLTEPNWILSTRYRAEGGADPAYFLGSGVVTWIAWVLAAVPGYWLGASVGDPRSVGLDLIMPAFFTAMLVPLWRGPRKAAGWVVGAVVAVATDILVGGWWYVITGALAGCIAGGLADDRK
jgi:predicted branched-subunit amino acid permease